MRCRLYLVGPPAPVAAARLEQVLDAAEVACFLLRPAEGASEEARRTVALIQARGTACVVDGDAALAASLGADGVHLDGIEGYAAARSVLGADAIVGVACGTSRHAAMEAGEAGADYVAFTVATDDDVETVRDWSETTVVPCVAWLKGPQLVAAAIAAGPEFLAVGDIWQAPGGPVAALRAYADRLAQSGA